MCVSDDHTPANGAIFHLFPYDSLRTETCTLHQDKWLGSGLTGYEQHTRIESTFIHESGHRTCRWRCDDRCKNAQLTALQNEYFDGANSNTFILQGNGKSMAELGISLSILKQFQHLANVYIVAAKGDDFAGIKGEIESLDNLDGEFDVCFTDGLQRSMDRLALPDEKCAQQFTHFKAAAQ